MTDTPLAGSVIGFIGLGLMGRPMSENLRAAGAEVVVHNRSREVVDEMAALGFATAATPREVAERCRTVVVMVSDTPAVERVLCGESGVIEAAGPEHLIVDMGTTTVAATRSLADRFEARGARYVDAPVSGGEAGARAGTLSVMAGGDPTDIARCEALFDVLGSKTVHVGPTGAGQVAKAANQVVVGLTIGAVAEALTLARRAGADPAKVREALLGGFAGSRILEAHGQRMIDESFRPGARSTTQQKDLRQAVELARSLDLTLPATALCLDLYDRLVEQGDGELDHSALIRVLDVEP